ncbi:MAG: hypothetical protein AAGE80_02600 [Pseudomonadota bacterium]
MSDERQDEPETLVLSTKVEEEFVSPLTAIRGALEILRDFDDLTEEERRRFVTSALDECLRLEAGIDGLAVSVYAAGREQNGEPAPAESVEGPAGRLRFLKDLDIADLDLSGIVFENSASVAAFFEVIHRIVDETGRRWFFIADHRDCQVWPEAWVAFAHHAKKMTVNYGLGSLRYEGGEATGGPYPTRDEALAQVAQMRTKRKH